MTMNVAWDNPEKTVILDTIHGRWTWDELYQTLNAGRELMDTVPHDKVDFIVDMTDCKLLPENALSNFARMANKPHPKSGRMVMAGATSFIRALLNVMGKYQGTGSRAQNVLAVQTVEEARDVLAAHRRFDAPTN